MIDTIQLSPEELALLETARRLGITGALLEETRRKEMVERRRAAEERARTLAYRAYGAAIGVVNDENAEIAVTVVIAVGDDKVAATYPPSERRTRTVVRSRGNGDGDGDGESEIDHLVQRLKDAGIVAAVTQELRHRALRDGKNWQGIRVALRTRQNREIAERFLSNATN